VRISLASCTCGWIVANDLRRDAGFSFLGHDIVALVVSFCCNWLGGLVLLSSLLVLPIRLQLSNGPRVERNSGFKLGSANFEVDREMATALWSLVHAFRCSDGLHGSGMSPETGGWCDELLQSFSLALRGREKVRSDVYDDGDGVEVGDKDAMV